MKATSILLFALLTVSPLFGQDVNRAQLAIFGKLPEVFESEKNPLTQEKIDLGRKLYYEPRLSKAQEISCNSCHDLASYGVDNLDFSIGHLEHRTGRNSPTVLNAAGHLTQFWDGRAPDVEEQAKGPVLAGGEMGMPSEEYVVTVLKSIPGYVEEFAKTFPGEDDPVTYDNMAKAIGAFERKLVTPAPFDDYVEGDDEALTEAQKRGLQTFISTGCITCHMGPLVGGMTYQKLGLVKPWPALTDKGRGALTGNAAEDYFLKVPSLRNVDKTGPYLHDGSINSLPLTVGMMAEYQLGKTLTNGEIADITAFLESLTGEIDAEFVKKPQLPPNGPNTPKPDFSPAL